MGAQEEPSRWRDYEGQAPNIDEDPSLPDRIRRLVDEEHYCVLCTQGQKQPYGSVIAHSFTDDLKWAVFATPIATRKYRLLSECDCVALVVDNRERFPEDMTKIEAITATGRASVIPRGEGFAKWADLLLTRHPYFDSFLAASSTALFRVEIVRYLHVVRFQEVRQWIPESAS